MAVHKKKVQRKDEEVDVEKWKHKEKDTHNRASEMGDDDKDYTEFG